MITKYTHANFDLKCALQALCESLQSVCLMMVMLQMSIKLFFHVFHAKGIQESWVLSMREVKSSLRSLSCVLQSWSIVHYLSTLGRTFFFDRKIDSK